MPEFLKEFLQNLNDEQRAEFETWLQEEDTDDIIEQLEETLMGIEPEV